MDNGLHQDGGGTALATADTIQLTAAEIQEAPMPPPKGAPTPAPAGTTQRLLSLDAYRGLIMIVLASGGFALGTVARGERFRDDPTWRRCLSKPITSRGPAVRF